MVPKYLSVVLDREKSKGERDNEILCILLDLSWCLLFLILRLNKGCSKEKEHLQT